MKKLTEVLKEVHGTTDFLDLANIEVNSKGLFNNSPLHVTVTWGEVDSAQLLLDNGADVNAIGEYGQTPLHRALVKRDRDMVALLVSRGADPSIKNQDGKDAQTLARELGMALPSR